MFEMYMIDNVTCHIEEALPTSWSANTFTVIGNFPMYIAGLCALKEGGLAYGHEMPSWVYYFAAAAITHFSWFDIMDGQRARRLKCGTPIGRIIDEAGDMFIYTWVAFIMGYVVKVEPGWLCLSYGLILLPAYTQEMIFVTTGKYNYISGAFDIGPVEIELIMTSIFLSAAIFGTQSMNDPINTVFGVDFIPMGDWLKLNQVYCCFFVFLLLLFSLDNLRDTFAKDFNLSLRMITTPVILFAHVVTAGYLEVYSYRKNFALFYLMFGLTMGNAIYRLMIANMTKKVH